MVENYVISGATRATTFKITDAKIYVPIVTFSTQDNEKILKQLKAGLKEQLGGTNIIQKKK